MFNFRKKSNKMEEIFDTQNFDNELNKIKTNSHSFLGIDGGNINAKVWISGLEFGSDLENMKAYYKNYVKTYNKDGYRIPYRNDCSDDFMKSTYDRFLALFYINFFNDFKFLNTETTTQIDVILKNELYNKDSKIFKLNLYPLAKKDTSWNPEITKQFGISKSDYYGELFEKRKSFLKKMVKKYEPKIIICTSPKYYRQDFVDVFIEEHKQCDFSWENLNIGTKSFRITEYAKTKTKVVVIPFLGRGNLCSHTEVIEMAHYLRKKYPEVFPIS
jgi:hypothetical protein